MLIKNKTFTSKQSFTSKSDITFEHCTFSGIRDVAITFNKCSKIIVRSCVFFECGGIYAVNCSDVVVEYCSAENIHSPKPRGQFFQSNHCQGPIWIHHNYIKCDPSKTYSGQLRVIEDIVNLHKTYCSQRDRAIIEYNNIDHGGVSPSGGGLLVGDNGGSWQVIRHNKLHTPGQYGIACAGGEDMELVGNEIYSPRTSVSNVGLYVWPAKPTTPDVRNVLVRNNKSNWVSNKTGNSNGFWKGPRVHAMTSSNNDWQWNGIPDLTTFLDGTRVGSSVALPTSQPTSQPILEAEGFYYVNSRTGEKQSSSNNTFISGGNWTIEYIPSKSTEYVEFLINGKSYRKEGVAPYVLSGDVGGAYNRLDVTLKDGTVITAKTSYGSKDLIINPSVKPQPSQPSQPDIVYKLDELSKLWIDPSKGELHLQRKLP